MPASSCSSTLRSASASACSWRCCIIATFAWLPQTIATTSPAWTISASRSAWRSARHRFVEAAVLRERHAGQRVDQREVAPVAGGVQRRGRLRDVLADDGAVADLPVAEAELVVGEADGARVVRALRLLQRAREKRNAARRLPLGDRQLAVQPPELGQPGGMQPLALFGRMAQRVGRLTDVVLQEPRFGQRRSAAAGSRRGSVPAA